MTRDIRFEPAAKEELRHARDWHEQQQAGLGEEFARDFDRSLAEAQRASERFPRFHLGTHRCILSRFPYLVVFVIEPDHILVVAVFHGGRRPRYWRDRIK